MELEGKVWKKDKHWLVEIPALDAMTQGKTRADAIAMAKDLVGELVQSYFGNKIKTEITEHCGILRVTASDAKVLVALSLRRQREKGGSTVREASLRLGSKSPNAYAQYEKGKTNISLDKYEELLHAANPNEQLRLVIAGR